MNRSLMTAASGMQAQQLNVDTIANNIANSNTTGFKGSNLDFRSLFYQTMRQPGAPSGNAQMDASGLQVGSGVDIAGSRLRMGQGTIQNTGNQYDMAIEGQGFFQVRLPNSELRYTRDGAFRLDSNGQLVTGQGYLVDPPVTFPQGVTEIAVAPSGEISYLDQNGEVQDLGVMQITRFPNPYGLRAEGGNLYAETRASGAPQAGIPGQNGAGFLVHQSLEGSNISTVEELVALIVAQRSYEMNSRAVQVSDEILQTNNQMIR